MEKKLMDSYTAVGLAEGFIEGTTEEQRQAWQYLVDTGLAWQLQGWFGRTAMALIESGEITAPKVEIEKEPRFVLGEKFTG